LLVSVRTADFQGFYRFLIRRDIHVRDRVVPRSTLTSIGGYVCKDNVVTGICTDRVPEHLDGPSLVAAASGLMLLPVNASRLVRLRRLAALGAALADKGSRPASPSAVRSILKQDDIGGRAVQFQEDPYSEVLIQSVTFFGGPYLVSPGSGEHAVADLENLIDATFREAGMPNDLRGRARQLIQGLLTVSDIVLRKAGLRRGTPPTGAPRTPIDVPGAARLNELTAAAFISNAELDDRGEWLRSVLDSLALDPGQLANPCDDAVTDERLYVTPFLRLADGYRVILPLDLAVTIRFHLLRYTWQRGQLEELAKRWRGSAFHRFMRLLPSRSTPQMLEQSKTMSRYLLSIDGKRDAHIVVATDPLIDWQPEVWGSYDTEAALERLAGLISSEARRTYSKAEEVLHLVIMDSPGRGAFWGVPNVDGAEPVIIARADDLEVILHHEPDGLLGLLLFAKAVERRPGRSMSTGLLDEFCSYIEHEKSFYLSDGAPADFTVFQTGDGLYPRLRYQNETDRHGVVAPIPNPPILQARRRYGKDAREIFIIEPNGSYTGYVVELDDKAVFLTGTFENPGSAMIELDLLECVAYWVRECAKQTGCLPRLPISELVVTVGNSDAWQRMSAWSTEEPAVRGASEGASHALEFSETFVALLQAATNVAERELVTILLTRLFQVPSRELESAVNTVAHIGGKRMLNAFNQADSPDMMAERLPRPLRGHDQVTAQLLDELGEWLMSPGGGGFSIGEISQKQRIKALNAAVGYLFRRLESEIKFFDPQKLLDFLVAQNEALIHDAKLTELLLRSRLACFGEHSDTASELVQSRRDSASAQRANRFLIEYVASQPPKLSSPIEPHDYYRILAISSEIIERATISDFLNYKLADFQISILDSGRLGVSREEPVTAAMDKYAENSGMRSVRVATSDVARGGQEDFDIPNFIADSEPAMGAEFGFTLNELREVCGGLLDLATADMVTRIDRSFAVAEIATKRSLQEELVSAVLEGITLTERASFLDVGADAWPWRFNRDMSYVRRPLVLQGDELVYGFRSLRRLGPYWVENMLSGRLQGRAKTTLMQQCISNARGRINDAFARTVAACLEGLGMTTRMSVKKIGKRRIADPSGRDLGDIDILAGHAESRSIIAIEAKDFEVARTPAEIAREIEKLFSGTAGKKSTTELHTRRIEWLRQHSSEVVSHLYGDTDTTNWRVTGAVVTSEPLITPLVSSTALPVISLDDVSLASLNVVATSKSHPSKRRTGKQRVRG
jgi:hypothetical protein